MQMVMMREAPDPDATDPLKVRFQNADVRNASIPLLYGGG